MPVLNEEGYLADAVAAVLSQSYPAEAELVIALGASTDRTTEIAHELAAADDRVRLVDNPANDIPVGLNLAIAASRHPIVVRVDAHAELPENYTLTMVGLLNQTGAVNVGGVMHAKGRTPFQSAVARAYNSPWGSAGASTTGRSRRGRPIRPTWGCFGARCSSRWAATTRRCAGLRTGNSTRAFSPPGT